MRCFGLLLLASTAWPASCVAAGGDMLPAPGAHGHYAVLTAVQSQPPPVAAVDFGYGPRQEIDGQTYLWWQLELRDKDAADTPPIVQIRGLTREDPMLPQPGPLHWKRYLLRIADAGAPLEYRNVHSGEALLPAWRDFARYFLPHAAPGSGRQQGLPETCNYLGHVLTLRHTGSKLAWDEWKGVKLLTLDPELLVGTGRSFKDKEGHRLPQQPQRQNYTYVPFTADDYRTMIQSGINLYTVDPAQEQFVRDEPVFYLRGIDGSPSLRYPADLYRSNYVGTVMFMDEPTILITGDKQVNTMLRYFSDAAALIRARVEAEYNNAGGASMYNLETALRKRGVHLGDVRTEQFDFPAWETIFETAHYQMEGGLNGFVHEGRYQLAPFDKAVARFLGTERKHTSAEMLRYHYAFLRGGTRPLGKYWGMSIYGQCDPQIAPEAVTLAYDLGARYVWFWTSDHDHHVPWPEQLALSRKLKEHAAAHPRRSIAGPQPALDTAIALPYGYFASFDNLWWVRVLDPQGKNEASQKYRRLMQNLLRAYHDALDRGEDFDFVIDTGKEIVGYRKVVRVSDQ